MALDRNPRVPTQENLEYYFQQILQPKYHDKKESIDIGKGKSYAIPKLTFEDITLKPDESFTRGGRTFRPQEMFMQQNQHPAFAEYGDKYKQANLDLRKQAVKEIPSVQFSTQEVRLVKPTYGRTF